MATTAAGNALLSADRVDTDHLTSRPSVAAVADSVAFPVAALEAGSAQSTEQVGRFLEPWSLTPAQIPVGPVEVDGVIDLDPPEPGLPVVAIDRAAVLAWADAAPVGWAVAEAVRADDWETSIAPLADSLAERWLARRQAPKPGLRGRAPNRSRQVP